MASHKAKDLVTFSIAEPPYVVGRALRVTITDPKSATDSVYYVPLSCIASYTDKKITMDKWMAEKKCLPF